MKKYLPLSALLIAGVTPVFAEEDNNKLEEIVVVSSRVPMPLREIGTSVSVLEGADIQALGYNTLADALRTLPGIGVSNTGGVGAPTAVRIRGEDGNRTRVFIDGIDISDTSGTQAGPNFQHVLANGVDRVEVLRGPQGLTYGADAGGVINITTNSVSDGLEADVSAEGGRYGTQQIAANIAGGNGTIDGAISATDYETDGFNSRTDDLSRDDDGYENTTLHGRIGINAGESARLELIARDVDSDGEFDNCFDASFSRSDNCTNSFEQQAWRAVAQLDYDIFQHEISYMENDIEREFFTEGALAFFGKGELTRWEYLGQYRGGDALKLVYGFEYQDESFDNGDQTRERDQESAYLEYQGGFGDSLYITAGLRYDDNEDFGSYTSYRASGAYLFDLSSGELKLKATYGTGFRAPSLFEVAYNQDPNVAFPPALGTELQEEESEGWDLGLAWANDSGLYLEATYFDQEITDPIVFDPANFSGYLQGSGTDSSKGVELVGQALLLDSLTINLNYTYNDTETDAGLPRRRRPEHLANLVLQWQTLNDRLQLGLAVRGSYGAEGRDGDDADFDQDSLDDYTVVDINGSFTIWQGLSIYGRVENLFDEDYEEVPGFNTRGTAAYAGVRYTF
ncbi:MAG: TonB-dependent receptor [Pseudomonadota bacterium]